MSEGGSGGSEGIGRDLGLRKHLRNEKEYSGRHDKKRLKDWGYGLGQDGYKNMQGDTNEWQAVIIEQQFPWWWNIAKSLAFKINRVWLTSYPLESLELVSNDWCSGVNVDIGNHPSSHLINELHQSNILLIGGKVSDQLKHVNIWEIHSLMAIVSNVKLLGNMKNNWELSVQTIFHHLVGGVTNGKHQMYIYHRKSVVHHIESFPYHDVVRQDLRWILKSSVPGRNTEITEYTTDTRTASSVKHCGKGIIQCDSLLPYQKMNIQIHAPYLGFGHVVRQLTLGECLRAMDAPEQLVMLIKDTTVQELLLSSISTPGKILQFTLQEVISRISNVQGRNNKRSLPIDNTIAGCGPPIKRPCQMRSNCYQQKSIGKIKMETRRGLLKVSFDRMIYKPTLTSIPEHQEVDFIYQEERKEVPCYHQKSIAIKTDPNQRATKRDDAEVQVDLWDSRLLHPFEPWIHDRDVATALVRWRRWLLSLWKRSVLRSYMKWQATREAPVSREIKQAATDCLMRVWLSTWWNWNAGSRPMFWRWPIEYQQTILEGHRPWFKGTMKRWLRKQREPMGEHIREMVRNKLSVIRDKKYVESGKVHSFMPYFDVPKGDDDIRMVFDGTANGLNNILWAPWFPLPTVESLIRAIEPGYGLADNDVGEMFHNFILHKEIRQYCGLDLTPFFGEELKTNHKRVQVRWNRLAMGLRCSPYFAVQAMAFAQEVILGDRTDETNNIFHWHKVCLNLPGTHSYNPSEPWFYKVRRNGQKAADIFVYVDDIRSSAPTIEEAWKAAQRTSSVLGYLGLQDAARKRRRPSVEAGAWTGSVVWTSNNEVSVLTTQEKWDKAKRQLKWIADQINNPKGIESKELLSIRGFLVYLTRTYPTITPYLKGLHATIDSWRPGRDHDGWKFKKGKVTQGMMDDLEEMELAMNFDVQSLELEKQPLFVQPVPRLKHDLHCLMTLLESDHPPRRRVRMNQQAQVVYGFGDASKQGFGASIELPNNRLYWRFGKWTLEDENKTSPDKEHSSNYRELRNLVEALEAGVNSGDISNCDVFMFTDNSTAEAAYNKGTSSSQSLFELVLRLRKLEMMGINRFHLIHVAGTRMIYQGTDGLSRGDHTAGVMAGARMIEFVPLHLAATERSNLLLPWIRSIFTTETGAESRAMILEPNDWPLPQLDLSLYIWIPPPAIADIAGEYMTQSILKRPTSTHIFICPRLMTSRWMRLIRKASDMIFQIPVGSPIWNARQHEPLFLTISFPLHSQRAGRFKEFPECEHQQRIVQEMFNGSFEQARTALRQLLTQAGALGSL